MSLAGILSAVIVDLEQDGVAAQFRVGRDQIRREADATAGRVVFVPSSFSYGPVGDLNGGVGGNARPLAVRSQSIDVHVWARAPEQGDPELQRLADFDAMATLADRVLRAFHRTCRGSTRWGTGDTTDTTETLDYGCEGVFTVTLGLPVTDTAWPYAPKDTTPVATGEMQNAQGAWVRLAPAT